MGKEIFVARQPIFDRQLNIYGYELLHRHGEDNFSLSGNDEQKTATLLDNTFLVFGFNELTEGKPGFFNFSKEFLQDDIPLLLPKDLAVIEILESVEFSEPILEVCRNLKRKGYRIALDDYVIDRCNLDELIGLIDIIKVEYPSVPLQDQKDLLHKYRDKVLFLAEKVETKEEFRQAYDLGYELFQGFFFSKPQMSKTTDIHWIDTNLMRISEELHRPDPDYRLLASYIEKDLSLTYKLLRMSNSVFYGATTPIHSVHPALVHLGVQEMIRWVYLMLLKGTQTQENAELVKMSLIRGRVLYLLAEGCRDTKAGDFFLTGIFSSIHVLMNASMEKLMGRLPLSPAVKEALTGKSNKFRDLLDAVLAFEKGEWDVLDKTLLACGISRQRYMSLYLEAIQWQRTI